MSEVKSIHSPSDANHADWGLFTTDRIPIGTVVEGLGSWSKYKTSRVIVPCEAKPDERKWLKCPSTLHSLENCTFGCYPHPETGEMGYFSTTTEIILKKHEYKGRELWIRVE